MTVERTEGDLPTGLDLLTSDLNNAMLEEIGVECTQLEGYEDECQEIEPNQCLTRFQNADVTIRNAQSLQRLLVDANYTEQLSKNTSSTVCPRTMSNARCKDTGNRLNNPA